ncbi:alpha/beta hydrolase [Kribbella sandramycini]|uniref:Alpha/beta hydrolase n=1 Tax=Kribbella sandramycini TaxID=60450 RepID=A0A7Y4NXQ6_9ACTN|nr:alpha/beta hydrolase [Kribbella sandramycini]MBB6567259.1 pimeloyl-ACP methyl ester carboxylesterase [Kribbella sandramycini]NOL40127.1 alpha/beta hydrolase [Kribbella sandramycini]
MSLHPGAGLTEQYVVLPGGRRLRAITAGRGDGPLVVFEAGMSAPAACWAHTQRELSAQARTLSYDRAGYGGSDVDPADRTLERIADDLTALLDALGETAPVVLVGHSWGGPIIRLFAERHPERVAGLVFIDATIVEVMPASDSKLLSRSFAVMGLLARLGGKNLIVKQTIPHWSPEISMTDRELMTRDYACVRAMRAARREAQQVIPALTTMRRLQAAGTPDVPTICLQAGRVDRGMKQRRPLFNHAAAELMAAVPRGRVEIAADTGHLVPQENPAATHAAIREILTAAS